MKLSPALLEQTHPKFIFIWRSKCKLRCSSYHWKIVIDDDRCLKPINKEGELVYSCLINGFCFYQGLNSIRKLGHRAKNCEEVTVSKHTLPYIARLNCVRKYLWIVKDFGYTLPWNVSKLDLFLLSSFFKERGEDWEKFWVGPWLTLANNLFNKFSPDTVQAFTFCLKCCWPMEGFPNVLLESPRNFKFATSWTLIYL